MARKLKIKLVQTKCRRCGKPVATVNRSITGADEAHRKFSGICGDCITPDEEREVLAAQAEAIRGRP